MNQKLAPVLALFIGLLTCSIEGRFKCVTPGTFPVGGGVIQPLVSSPQIRSQRVGGKAADDG